MEKKKKIRFFHSIKLELLLFSIVPLVLLGSFTSITAEYWIKKSLHEKALTQMQAVCVAVRAGYDNLNDGKYTLNADGDLLKGDYNITKDVEALDKYKEGMDIDVTIFYGDTRKATSLLDDATGERIIGTTASKEVADAVLGGEEFTSTHAGVNGKNYFACYIPLKDPDGTVVGMVFAGEDSAEIDANAASNSSRMFIYAAVWCVLMIIIDIFAAFRIAGVIEKARKAVDNLAGGNLSFQVDPKILRRKDELGEMGRSVEGCVASIHAIVGDIQNVAGNVQSSSNELETMATQTSHNADDISHAVEDVSKGAVAQAEDVESATMEVSDMGQVIETIVSDIAGLNDISEGMNNAGTEASRIIKELSNSNDKTVEAIRSVWKNVVATDESVKRISEAVEMITNIAEQTNLLSLNAAIEAARAGESGKGFAVVASEIQKLSEESNKSAQCISEIIRGLSEDSRSSIVMMEELKTRLKEQQENLNATMHQFENVNQGIATTREGTVKINGQAKACDTSRKKVVDLIQNLSAISEENAASTEQTTASVEELNATIGLLAESAGKLKDLSSSLAKSIEFFKL